MIVDGFQVGDRVLDVGHINRPHPITGRITAINGEWVTVQWEDGRAYVGVIHEARLIKLPEATS